MGQYNLNFLDDSSGFSTDLSGNREIRGSSLEITQPPFGFYVHLNNDPDVANASANNSNSSVFKTAGDAFTLSVRAVAWQASDDVNNDNVPDNNSDLSNNASLPSFGLETPVEQIEVTHSLVQPASGSAGALSGGSNVTGFLIWRARYQLSFQ